MNVHQHILDELNQAETARRGGNEGRARVCARRAGGMAAREYLTRNGVPLPGPNALDALRTLAELPGLPADLATAARHLTARLTETFTLPEEADLISDARLLHQKLILK